MLDDSVVGDQHHAFARVGYQRDLTFRLAAGLDGFHQRRTGRGLAEVHSVAVTVSLTARLGHAMPAMGGEAPGTRPAAPSTASKSPCDRSAGGCGSSSG